MMIELITKKKNNYLRFIVSINNKMKVNLNIIYNKNIQGIIGINGDLLLNIKKDLEWFKEHTIHNIVVMGYNTFKSLPGSKSINPLSKRLNIVISKNHFDTLIEEIKDTKENVIVYRSFEDFYNQWVPNKTNNYQNFHELNEGKNVSFLEEYKYTKDIFIIGGSQLYNYVLTNYNIDAIYETITDIEANIKVLTSNGNQITYFKGDIPKDKYIKSYEKKNTRKYII